MKTSITLDESSHVYEVNGVVKPSVTQVLNEWIEVDGWYVNVNTGVRIPSDSFERAGVFGKAFHKAAKFIVDGKNIKYHEDLEYAISELRRWMADYASGAVSSEMRGYSPKLDVCGTLDWIGGINCNNEMNLVDYKTGADSQLVGPQTWVYKQIYRAMTGYKGIIKRWVLYIPKREGSYRFIELKDNVGDEFMFKSCNYKYNWLRRI